MVRRARIFIEGGGDSNAALKIECRKAFRKLLERAGFEGRMPQLLACGRRQNAFDQFRTALDEGDGRVLLLVDSESAVAPPVEPADPWQHVAQRSGDRWTRPQEATAEHLHLMVQCMEAWFLADRRALAEFFGQGFQEGALPPPTRAPEEVDKGYLFSCLKQATRMSKTKGAYEKGRHSFSLLATLDPSLVRKASPWADRLFATLDRWMR